MKQKDDLIYNVYFECLFSMPKSRKASSIEFLIAYGMLYFIEVLLEALFLTVDPYMRYDFPPKKSSVVLRTPF